ncbi:MAG TPA: (Fe-S)-binding protein, partial [Spirochaetia bacterium]|nr:(Fe-S)-binding protein [Spirochaetia bacterium]
ARLGDGRLELEVADEGPGIPDVQLALREGWSTASEKARQLGFGAGLGLPNIRRNSDRFDIETRVGRGTRIRSTILLEAGAAAGAVEPGHDPAVEPAPGISPERCNGCLRCIFACPTGALRVHDCQPLLRPALCVGCTECAAACPHAVFTVQPVERLDGRRPLRELAAAGQDAVVVLPRALLLSPLLGRSPAAALDGLALLGFREVRFTEEWEDAVQREARLQASRPGAAVPVIAPVCPSVTALVEGRFPSLIPNLAMTASPLDAAGEEFPLRPVVLVAACAAQLVSAGTSSLTDRLTVITPADLCEALRVCAPSAATAEAPTASAQGAPAIPFLRAPRETPPACPSDELCVSGARDVLRALSAVEAGALDGIRILTPRLCTHGCSGSPFVIPDSFLSTLAGPRLLPLLSAARESDAGAVTRSTPYRQRTGMRLSADMASAIQALGRIDELLGSLPGRDCGACGAPACALYAEDVVMGRSGSSSCPHASLTREGSQ